MARIGRKFAQDFYPQTRQFDPSTAVFLFGDGSDGDIVIDTPNTPVNGILNANSIRITSSGSIRVPPGDHCLLRSRTSIIADGPINGDATISASNLGDSVAIIQYIGSTQEGGSGGGGGGGSGTSGNGSAGAQGSDGAGKFSAMGFSQGTGSNGGAPGAGGVGGVGSAGGNATLPVAGTDITDLSDHLHLYPAGPGGDIHGSLPGFDGQAGVIGGTGSGGAAVGGDGGLGGIGGLGASMILLVSPQIVLNALVSSNGGAGTSAPSGSDPGAPTAGANAPGGSNNGGGGGGSGGGGGAGGAGGCVLLGYGTLTENVTPQANPGAGGLGSDGGAGGAKDGVGFAGGKGGRGADGATGSTGFVIRQKIV